MEAILLSIKYFCVLEFCFAFAIWMRVILFYIYILLVIIVFFFLMLPVQYLKKKKKKWFPSSYHSLLTSQSKPESSAFNIDNIFYSHLWWLSIYCLSILSQVENLTLDSNNKPGFLFCKAFWVVLLHRISFPGFHSLLPDWSTDTPQLLSYSVFCTFS